MTSQQSSQWLERPLGSLMLDYPQLQDFFTLSGLFDIPEDKTMRQHLDRMDALILEDAGTSQQDLEERFMAFLANIEILTQSGPLNVSSLTIEGGKDKHGEKEALSLTLHAGEVVSILGPTGSGKSRLLEDIEWLAQGNTPTERTILVNGKPPQQSWRSSLNNKLVAQLTQNMNFVMDVSVGEFLLMHAQCRMVKEEEMGYDRRVDSIIAHANSLTGEAIYPETPLTSLSGGQSRALMIADTVFLSVCPIILIDEIENAGIHRRKALSLLEKKGKIVLIATHDPILALMANKRVIMAQGGIRNVLETSPQEKERLYDLEKMDEKLMDCKEKLRKGEVLT